MWLIYSFQFYSPHLHTHTQGPSSSSSSSPQQWCQDTSSARTQGTEESNLTAISSIFTVQINWEQNCQRDQTMHQAIVLRVCWNLILKLKSWSHGEKLLATHTQSFLYAAFGLRIKFAPCYTHQKSKQALNHVWQSRDDCFLISYLNLPTWCLRSA